MQQVAVGSLQTVPSMDRSFNSQEASQVPWQASTCWDTRPNLPVMENMVTMRTMREIMAMTMAFMEIPEARLSLMGWPDGFRYIKLAKALVKITRKKSVPHP